MNRGYLAPKITSDRTTKTHSFTSKERSDGLVSKTTFSSEQISYSENKTTFVLENIPALNDEEFVNNIKN